jgi:glucosamine kinase
VSWVIEPPVVLIPPTASGSGSAADEQRTAAVVGVDIGATKTHIARQRPDGFVEEHSVPTPSWRTGTSAGSAPQLAAVLADVLGPDGLTLPLAVGAHGCDTTGECLELQGGLDALTTATVLVVNDAELMPWAMDLPEGIGVVAGTGSIAVTRDRHGELITAGGWGWILGDEGSASAIVRESVRAVLLRRDLGKPDDPLARRMFAAFHADSAPELAMALSKDSSAHRWGAQAPEVFAAADEGSAAAATVIDQAGRGLAELLDRLLVRGLDTREVVVGGSVIVAQSRLQRAFLDAVRVAHPDARVTVLTRAPVYGALALARSGITRLVSTTVHHAASTTGTTSHPAPEESR